ncbi:transcription initiation factor IIA, gamma subunit, helical domain-containing protein [Paraphysoderma sedebokerense]|nr:transcription initiation factor IIA, gamma subunit, helical domain-containing protein [Paraphysoderma sedebokerense]
MASPYELYRRSTLGMCLTDALDELIQTGQINPQLAHKVLLQFDKSVTEALNTQVRAKASFKGSLDIYRFCDDVWTFILKNPNFRFESDNVSAEKLKIVACNAKKPE